MNNVTAQARITIRCAVYTRKSTEEGLKQEFNTLDAQREDPDIVVDVGSNPAPAARNHRHSGCNKKMTRTRSNRLWITPFFAQTQHAVNVMGIQSADCITAQIFALDAEYMTALVLVLEHFAFETLRVSTHHSEKKRRFSQNPRRLCGGRLGLLAARAFSYFQ